MKWVEKIKEEVENSWKDKWKTAVGKINIVIKRIKFVVFLKNFNYLSKTCTFYVINHKKDKFNTILKNVLFIVKKAMCFL